MNIQDVVEKIEQTQAKLDAAGVSDDSKLDLDIFALTLGKALQQVAIDRQKELSSAAAAEASRLTTLCREVEAALHNQRRRSVLLEQVVQTALSALKTAGLDVSFVSQCSCRCFKLFQ